MVLVGQTLDMTSSVPERNIANDFGERAGRWHSAESLVPYQAVCSSTQRVTHVRMCITLACEFLCLGMHGCKVRD